MIAIGCARWWYRQREARVNGETVYYEQGSIRVTASRFVVGEETYPLGQITSVKLEELGPKNGCLVLAAVLGLGIGAIFAIAGITQLMTVTDPWASFGTAFLLLVIGGLFLLAARSQNYSTYAVQITTAAGEQQVLKDRDASKPRAVVDAINEALIDRG
jgi:hypothetical protein